MEITLNNELKIVKEQSSLLSIVNEFIPGKPVGIAIAVNDTVIPKSVWEQHYLNPKDNILIIFATQGG